MRAFLRQLWVVAKLMGTVARRLPELIAERADARVAEIHRAEAERAAAMFARLPEATGWTVHADGSMEYVRDGFYSREPAGEQERFMRETPFGRSLADDDFRKHYLNEWEPDDDE